MVHLRKKSRRWSDHKRFSKGKEHKANVGPMQCLDSCVLVQLKTEITVEKNALAGKMTMRMLGESALCGLKGGNEQKQVKL